jgi:hypothetical protein
LQHVGQAESQESQAAALRGRDDLPLGHQMEEIAAGFKPAEVAIYWFATYYTQNQSSRRVGNRPNTSSKGYTTTRGCNRRCVTNRLWSSNSPEPQIISSEVCLRRTIQYT